ncbi:MAG: hypothetical protein ABN482_11265 [Corticimicrobacter sp.]|uniref:hypothetical protein n=1 Tax=Corticimicrobacter sp. TaxID=2678536 RepID=UPI0032DA1CE1
MFPSHLLSRPLTLRLLLWALVLAVLVRALVPFGYMPDRTARNATWLGLSLCLSSDRTLAVVQKTWEGEAIQGADGDTVPDCMFGVMSQPVLDSMRTGDSVGRLLLSWHIVLLPIFQAIPVQPAIGPPLGQRAPPGFA